MSSNANTQTGVLKCLHIVQRTFLDIDKFQDNTHVIIAYSKDAQIGFSVGVSRLYIKLCINCLISNYFGAHFSVGKIIYWLGNG